MEADLWKLILCFLSCLTLTCSTVVADHERSIDVFQLNKNGEVDWSSDFETELRFDDYDDVEETLPHLFPSNGDIRLVTSTSFLDSEMAGRLEVYIQSMYCTEHNQFQLHDSDEEYGGKWGTVCGQGFSLKEAHVACRQMGFQGAQKWNYSIYTEFGMANESTPIMLTDVSCSSSNHQHLLRCDHVESGSSELEFGCDHTKDVVVYCDTTMVWDQPYNGQVRLASEDLTAQSYGRVEIFQGQQWGTVCKENFNEAAAISVCRQLGYTGAVAVTDAKPGTGLVWVNEIGCESPQPCFTACFTHHKWTHDCNHTQDVAIKCAYDVNRASLMTSGGSAQCKINIFPVAIVTACITLALSALLVIGCGLVFLIVITRCFRRKLSPKILRYEQLS